MGSNVHYLARRGAGEFTVYGIHIHTFLLMTWGSGLRRPERRLERRPVRTDWEVGEGATPGRLGGGVVVPIQGGRAAPSPPYMFHSNRCVCIYVYIV